jgi:signal peptidase I
MLRCTAGQTCSFDKEMPRLFLRPTAIASAVLTFFAIILFLMFAPSQLGGSVTYVIVDGNSMEPGFHLGDLLLVREKQAYSMGDAVVYQNAEMESYVFHRIVGTDLGRYVLKGDNNSWLDSYLPVQDEIVGKLWFHIPKLGLAIEWMRVPLHMALMVGLMGGVLMLDMFKKNSAAENKRNAPPPFLGGLPELPLYILGFLTLSFLAAGIYAFTRPLHQTAESIPYQQEGYFYYSATGTPGVYDTDTVRSGEPVFPKLACYLNVGYTYNIIGDHLQGTTGTYKMYARIMDDQSGWFRTIPLSAETTFAGNSYFALATLDLCQVEAIVNLVEQEAGLNQLTYTMEIFADSAFTANANGSQVADTFSPSLVFRYDKVHFYLAGNKSQADPLRSSKPGLVMGTTARTNTISILGLAFPVWMARFISLLGFVLSALGLVYIGMNIYRTASHSQDALIRLKHGPLLMDVSEQNPLPSGQVIDVATMDDLVRLAERHGTMILHMQRNFLHYYLVQSNGASYRYVITTGKKGIPQADLPTNESLEQTQPTPTSTEVVSMPIPLPPQWEALIRQPIRQTETDEAPHHEIEITRSIPNHEPAEIPALPSEGVEYVIRTGAIEFEMPQIETTILRKIKL